MALVEIGEAYANFTESLSTETTLKHYLFCVSKYAVFRNTSSLDDIITQDHHVREATKHVRSFLASLLQKGLGQGSIMNYRHVLKHLYDMNDIILNWTKIAKFSKRDEIRKKDRGYSREEIQRMLDVSDLKSRALILLFASSSVRLGAIPSLKVGDLIKVDNLYQITVYAGSNDQYITFCSNEATKIIDSYLEYRRRCGEVIGPDSPLFRRKFDSDDKLKAKNKVKGIGINGISFLIKQARIKAGLSVNDVPRNHGFRKWGNTVLIQSKTNVAAKETLLGHSTGLDDKYYRPTDAELLEEYQKAENNLTISNEERLKDKVTSLEEQMESRIGKLEQTLKEFKDIQKRQLEEVRPLATQYLKLKAEVENR